MGKINIIGIFDDPDELVKGVRSIKQNGYRIKNVFSPFPVHGIWEEMNMKTRLPMLTFIYGAVATVAIFAFMYWTSVISYPLKFGGKPLNSLSFIIIMFVGVIFVGNLLTFMTFFIRQKIGPGKRSVMIDPRTVDDKFALVVERDPGFSDAEVVKIGELMRLSGAVEIKEEPEPADFREERDE